MLSLTMWALVFASLFISRCEVRQTITVGMLMVNDSSYLQPLVGYTTTASAVMIALDRIKQEHLLDNIDWQFQWYFSGCSEAKSSGDTNLLIQQDQVDVILGMPCSISTIITGATASYYNIPIISFASAATDFSDKNRFPTMARTFPSVHEMGPAFLELLNFFGWQKIALLYTNDGQLEKCVSIGQELQSSVYGTAIDINYIDEIMNVTEEAMSGYLDAVQSQARIIVACFDKDEDKRSFMLLAYDKQMTTDEYIYILPDYIPGANSDTLWRDSNSQNETDGRDNDAMKAFQATFILEFETVAESELVAFKSEIPVRMRESPFFCTTECNQPDDQYGSLYSPYLHDSMYLYAQALNKTVTTAPSQIRNGTLIRENSAMTFQGMSGDVIINDVGDRLPNFSLQGFDENGFKQTFGAIRTSDNYGQAQALELNYPYTSSSIWTSRGRQQPLDIPICGFIGNECPSAFDFVHQHVALVASVSTSLFLLLLLLTSTIVYVIYSGIQRKRIANKLWQIDRSELMEISIAHTVYSSDQSIKTTSTNKSMSSVIRRKRAARNGRYDFYNRNGEIVAVCKHQTNCRFAKEDEAEFRAMRALIHDNINQFHGLSMDKTGNMSVWKVCTRGSLRDIFNKDSIKLDWFFKFSLIRDIYEGMDYLHKSFLGVHGGLTSRCCLINDRWQVRLSDYGLSRIRSSEKRPAKDMLWTAPEWFEFNSAKNARPVPSADIYSFGILCSEIITEMEAYAAYKNENLSDDEIIYRIVKRERPPFRPIINLQNNTDINPTMLTLMRDCWAESAEKRPSMKAIRYILKGMKQGKKTNLMDHVMNMMEKYAVKLEEEVADRTKALLDEQQKSDILLYRMLPRQVADKLKSGQGITPESFDEVTIMFSDIVGFTKLASKSAPLQVVNMLNELCTVFDGIIDEHDAYKVETIGDGYLVVSGLPNRNEHKHAHEIANMSLAFQRSVQTFKLDHLPDEIVSLRIGIHTGPVVAGVVGLTMPRYCLFGDSVNTASRMESHGKPGHIHISFQANEFLADEYVTESRGESIIKGKGVLQTFWLRSKRTE